MEFGLAELGPEPDGGDDELPYTTDTDDGSILKVGILINVSLAGQGAPPPNGGGSVQVLDLIFAHSESH